jgi:predicted permease
MHQLLDLQLTMLVLMLAGLVLKKSKIIGDIGQKNITDLVIYLVLPCNIIKSFMIEFNKSILVSFATVLVISIVVQMLCTLLGRVLYNRFDLAQKKCLQYGTICSNAGFLGNPIAQGVFGSIGLSYASIFLIPQRIVMWSAGVSYFTESPNKKTLFKKVATHPCIVACYIGLFLMFTQLTLPGFLNSSIDNISNSCTALSMMVIGMILADVHIKNMFDLKVLYFTIIRLVIIPILVYIPGKLIGVESLALSVSVLLTAMPAGATTSILAAKYDGDSIFATKCVVFSTLASLISTPIWSFILTR